MDQKRTYGELNLRVVMLFVVCIVFMAVFPITGNAQDTQIDIPELQQQSEPLTLTQAINVALANNTRIKRAILSVQDAEQQGRIAWSELFPEVLGNASYTRNIELPVIFFPDPQDPEGGLRAFQIGEDNNWNGSLTVEQTLFRGEAIIGVGTLDIFKAVQKENLRATSQQIVTETRFAYYDVLIAEEQLRLQQATVDRLRENLKENRARARAGLIDEYEVLQVEVQLRNQEPQLTEARYAVQRAYRELKLVLGIPPDIELSVRGNLGEYNIVSQEAEVEQNQHIKKVDRMNPYSYEETRQMLDVASGLRGDIRVLDQRTELKESEIRAIKSRYLPSLSTSYRLAWRAEEPGAPDFFGNSQQRVRTQGISLNLEIPIFQGFERDANLEIARIEKKDLQLQKEFALRTAKNEIESARELLNQAIETADARIKALEQAQLGYDRARSRLENGIGSQLDVTNAEFQLRQAELNYSRMVYDYLVAKARYDQAVGMVPFVDSEQPN